MSLKWLFLDLNSYFASVEQAENPELQGKPVAVVPMMADTTCCLAASYPAKRFGVKTGTSVRDAKRMCPGIVFVKAEHRRYVSYHKKIVATVDSLLPVKRILSIDEMACELMGRECQEQFIRERAHQIKSAIAEQVSPALTCSIGIAPNRYLAKVASDMEKPDGLTVLHLETLREQLAALIPRDFPGVGPRMEKRFFEWGIRSAERMYDLTEREMREIWGGIVGERFYKAIRGEQTEERESERGSVSHSKVLAPESRSFESAWPVILNLLMKACMRLRSEGFYAKEMWVSLKYVERDRERRRWQQRARFAETCDSLLLVKELERLWESAPRRTLLRVGVALSQLIPARNHQIGIFEDPKRESLMQALDSINHRYQGNVVYPAGAHASRATRTNAIAFQRIPDESE